MACQMDAFRPCDDMEIEPDDVYDEIWLAPGAPSRSDVAVASALGRADGSIHRCDDLSVKKKIRVNEERAIRVGRKENTIRKPEAEIKLSVLFLLPKGSSFHTPFLSARWILSFSIGI